MQTHKDTLPDHADAQSLNAVDQDGQDAGEHAGTTPLLAEEQIIKLQNILRSMDHIQLQSVLAALEPNVLRLCLHAIFGRSKAPGQGLAEQSKTLAQQKRAECAAPSVSPRPAAPAVHPGVFRRLNPRTSIQKNAKIYCPIEKTDFDCLILDTSQSGALVFLDYTGELPETFDLFDIGDQKSSDQFTHLPHKKCECVWRKRNKMGVKFVG